MGATNQEVIRKEVTRAKAVDQEAMRMAAIDQEAIRMEAIREIITSANHLGACELLEGITTLEGLIELMFSPQGIEFCTSNHFPTLQQWRALSLIVDLTIHDIYVDKPHVQLSNPTRCVIVGDSSAVIHYDTLARQTLLCFHSPSVEVVASGWAVLFLYGEREGCKIEVKENAIVTQL